MNSLNRRGFLAKTSAAGIAAAAAGLATPASPAQARGPIQRSGAARFQLGLAAYSFREHFSFNKGKPKQPSPGGPPMTMESFLDYCVEQNCDAAELTSYFFDPKGDQAYYRSLKKHAFLHGIAISGTAIGNNFTVGRGERLDREVEQAKQWIERASILGAPHIRFFAGTRAEIEKSPERIDIAIDALAECADYAAEHGVMLGVENHGNLTAEQCLTIMDRVESPWVGMNLDTGNFFSDDPYGDLEKCIGYAVNVQVKVMMRRPDKTRYAADLSRVAKILRDGGYQGFVNLEYEEDEPYQNVPKHLDELRHVLM